MTAKEFLQNKLGSLFHNFDLDYIRYEFDLRTQSHLVEINPASLLEDDSFASSCLEIDDEFISEFPYDTVSFFNNDLFLKIERGDYILGPGAIIEYPELQYIDFNCEPYETINTESEYSKLIVNIIESDYVNDSTFITDLGKDFCTSLSDSVILNLNDLPNSTEEGEFFLAA